MSDDQKRTKIYTINDVTKGSKPKTSSPPAEAGGGVNPEAVQQMMNAILEEQKKVTAFWSQVNLNIHRVSEEVINIGNELKKVEVVLDSTVDMVAVMTNILTNKLSVTKENFAQIYSETIGKEIEQEVLNTFFGDE